MYEYIYMYIHINVLFWRLLIIIYKPFVLNI